MMFVASCSCQIANQTGSERRRGRQAERREITFYDIIYEFVQLVYGDVWFLCSLKPDCHLTRASHPAGGLIALSHTSEQIIFVCVCVCSYTNVSACLYAFSLSICFLQREVIHTCVYNWVCVCVFVGSGCDNDITGVCCLSFGLVRPSSVRFPWQHFTC